MIMWKPRNPQVPEQSGTALFHFMALTQDGHAVYHGVMSFVRYEDQCVVTVQHELDCLPPKSAFVHGDDAGKDEVLLLTGVELARIAFSAKEVWI